MTKKGRSRKYRKYQIRRIKKQIKFHSPNSRPKRNVSIVKVLTVKNVKGKEVVVKYSCRVKRF